MFLINAIFVSFYLIVLKVNPTVSEIVDGADEKVNLSENRSPEDQTSCTVPAITGDRTYSLQFLGKQCSNTPGKRVPQYSHVVTTCTDGYYSAKGNQTDSICINGQWISPIPRCQKICEPLKPVNEELTCFRDRHSAPVSCNGPLLHKSVVSVKCKEGYRPPGDQKLDFSLTCDEEGKWNDKLYQCVPDCGKSFGSGQNLIIHGKIENVGDSPWHVAIYSTTTSTNPELICGATIITENLIVSAAHCFRDEFGTFNDEERFEAIVAKHKRDYQASESSKMEKYKIKKIHYPSSDFLIGKYDNYVGDIALLETTTKIKFNKMVVPACVDWLAQGPFQPGKTMNGKMAGWGEDASGKPSDILQTALLPFISKSKCLELVNVDFRHLIKEDKFCAGNLEGAGPRPGDSGGGLLFRDVYTDSYCIRGIVSSKDTSNTALATFTDIGLYLDWIVSVRSQIHEE